jgi:hypothetical protein
MPATVTDRLFGENSSVAVKAPVVAVANAALSLNGLGPISTLTGSYTPQPGDRILVPAQIDPTTNGIYTASVSGWQRSGDFDGAYDVVNGTLIVVPVQTGIGFFYQLYAPNPITIGTTALTFLPLNNPNITYPITPAEIAAGVVPASYAYVEGDVRRYGAKCDGVTDDHAAVQTAVNFCVAANLSMTVHGTCVLGAFVNIDRQVDGLAYDDYFRIVGVNGGGFKVTSGMAMFSTTLFFMPAIATTGASGTGTTATITFAAQAVAPPIGGTVVVSGVTPSGYNGTYTITASSTTSVSYANATTGAQTIAGNVASPGSPVSQLICFEDITFIGVAGAYVLNDGRFLRTRFDKCDFDKISCCNSSIYTQSIQFNNCNMRRGTSDFWTSIGQSYDFKAIGNVVEAWGGNIFNLAKAYGCAIMGNLLEGCSGTAITYNGCGGFLVSGNYFEANLLDMDGTGINGQNQANGFHLIGNLFSHTSGNSNPNTYSVVWGNGSPTSCVSTGNYHNAKMHNFPVAGMDVLVKDSAVVSLWNNEPTPVLPGLMAFNDGALGSTYGGVVKGYGLTGRGGYLGLGTLNGGAYTEGLTIDYNGNVLIDKATPAAGATAVGQLGLGSTTATTATAGTQTLPANPAFFLTISLSGTTYKIPLYNV